MTYPKTYYYRQVDRKWSGNYEAMQDSGVRLHIQVEGKSEKHAATLLAKKLKAQGISPTPSAI